MVGTVGSPRATKGLKLPSLGLQGDKVWAEGQRDGILQGHLGPGGKILFSALCPTKQLLREPKPERSIWVYVQGRDMLWADTQSHSLFIFVTFLPQSSSDLCAMMFFSQGSKQEHKINSSSCPFSSLNRALNMTHGAMPSWRSTRAVKLLLVDPH